MSVSNRRGAHPAAEPAGFARTTMDETSHETRLIVAHFSGLPPASAFAVTYNYWEQESGSSWLMTALGHEQGPALAAPEGHPKIAQRFIAGTA